MNWLLVVHGVADASLYPFDADGWRLRHGDPARGMLGILPELPGATPASMDDALWLADAVAFDHDAPVAVRPVFVGDGWHNQRPRDPEGSLVNQPVEPLSAAASEFYWDGINSACEAAASLRFHAPIEIRYGERTTDPGTGFSSRFDGREQLLSLYAMAARQADVLAEYLCLYRVLEAADGVNGKGYATRVLPQVLDYDYGVLRVINDFRIREDDVWTDAFALYRHRARLQLLQLEADGADVPAYLYGIRNQIAHGKRDVLIGSRGQGFGSASQALPLLKLLARIAVEGG